MPEGGLRDESGLGGWPAKQHSQAVHSTQSSGAAKQGNVVVPDLLVVDLRDELPAGAGQCDADALAEVHVAKLRLERIQ
jgi:hypothetical protein